jgi:eukaryotic-like serine/threonine-protein kinase
MNVSALASRNDGGPRPAGSASGRFGPGIVLQDTYRILRPLAAGGMGEVFLATHERLHGAFAVKVLHEDFTQDEEAMCRFRCEAEIMAGLRHPNIVQVFDFNFTPDGRPYLVMELIEGRDLNELLRDRSPMPPARVARIVRQIASALEAAHAHGVVHRDLKPENVMVVSAEGHEDFIKVVDFGISKARWSERITSELAVMGTPQFMAPEQAQGLREEVDSRADQFALASITYTLLTGQEPFRGDSGVAVLYQVVHEDPEPLDSLVDWPCASGAAVLDRAMSKDRQARFATVLDFARALETAIAADLGTPECRATAPLALLATPADHVHERRLASTRMTVRHAPRVARPGFFPIGRLLAAMVVAALFFYLDANWQTVGPAFGAAYRNAVAATSRSMGRVPPTPSPLARQAH